MDISTGRIFRLAVPALLSMVSFNIMQFADRAFLSRYDSLHFAAVLPAGMFAFTTLSFFLGVVGFVSALSSQYTGAETPDAPARSAWQGIWFGLAAGVLLIGSAPFVGRIFSVLGHPEPLARLESLFYVYMCVSGLFSLLAAALGGYFSGLGDTRTPMIASVVANLLNIGLDWLLIFGYGGFPAMGIEGAAVATTIASAVNVAVLALAFFTARQRREHGTWRTMGFDASLFRRLLRFGTPAGFQWFLDMAGWGLMTLFLGRLGEKALMAVNVAITFESLAFMPAIGLATAASVLAGQARGAGKVRAIAVILRRSLTLVIVYEIFVMIFFIAFPEWLVGFFLRTGDEATFRSVNELAVPILRVTGIWLAVDGARIVIANVLRTLGDTFFMMIAYGVGAALLVTAVALIVAYAPHPLFTVWLTILGWAVCMWIAMLWRFNSGAWKSIKVIHEGH